jgi:flavin reductase (DIM6/NTAB) family NADH-FMN oxidoreductase RutF
VGSDEGIHVRSSDPFATPPELRDPARRFRSRLVAPVTIWTAFAEDVGRTGITVSSLVVAEGEPASILGLVGPVSDFWEAVGETKRFVVHVLDETQRREADDFAGLNPGPDAPFGTHPVSDSEWGPVLDAVPTRAFCQLGGFLDVGYFLMVRGDIEHLDIPDGSDAPLAYYRGDYVTTRPRRP